MRSVDIRNVVLIGCVGITLGACTGVDRAKLIARTVGISQNTIDNVQAITVQSCKFLPEIAFIKELFATGKYAGVANAIYAASDDICRVVTTQPLAEGPGKRIPAIVVGEGRYRKVIYVKGTFVK